MGLLFSMLDRAKVGKYDLSRRRKSLPPPARHVFNQNTCSFERQRPFLRVSSARGVISCLVGKMQCRASTGQKEREQARCVPTLSFRKNGVYLVFILALGACLVLTRRKAILRKYSRNALYQGVNST